jgi:methylated-DNA-[protein]-cysteine S-methyltransferase
MNVTIFDTTVEIDESSIAESSAAIREQVREYERGERRTFDLTVSFPEGSTGKVMAAMTEIPYGGTRTYGEITGDKA